VLSDVCLVPKALLGGVVSWPPTTLPTSIASLNKKWPELGLKMCTDVAPSRKPILNSLIAAELIELNPRTDSGVILKAATQKRRRR
jgi:hypothetical protein